MTITTGEEASKASSQLERFLQKKDDSPEGRVVVKGPSIELGALSNAWHASWSRGTPGLPDPADS